MKSRNIRVGKQKKAVRYHAECYAPQQFQGRSYYARRQCVLRNEEDFKIALIRGHIVPATNVQCPKCLYYCAASTVIPQVNVCRACGANWKVPDA